MSHPHLLSSLLGNIRDPDKEKRDRLMQLLADPATSQQLKAQLAANPSMADQLLGQAPRFRNPLRKDDYETDKALVGALSQQTPEDKLKAEEVKRLRGSQVANDPNLADATAKIDLSGLSANDVTSGLSPDAQQRYQEWRAKNTNSLTPKDREEQLAQIREHLAQGDSATASAARTTQATKIEGDVAARDAAEAQRIKDARVMANKALARTKSDDDIYKAVYQKSGLFAPDEINAIQAVPETAKRVDDARANYWEKQRIDVAKQSHRQTLEQIEAQYKLMTVRQMTEKYPELGWEDAKAMVEDPATVYKFSQMKPEDVPPDPQSQRLYKAAKALDDIRGRDAKKNIAGAMGKIQGSEVMKKIQKSGDAGAEDIDMLNTEARNAFLGTGYDAPVYGIKSVKSGVFSHAGIPIITKVDPNLEKFGIKPDAVGEVPAKGKGTTLPLNLEEAGKIVGNADDITIKAELKKQFPGATEDQINNTLTEINIRRKKK